MAQQVKDTAVEERGPEGILAAALPLNSLLREEAVLPRKPSSSSAKKKTKKAADGTLSPSAVGTVVEAKVTMKREFGYILSLDGMGGVTGIALHENVPGGTAKATKGSGSAHCHQYGESGGWAPPQKCDSCSDTGRGCCWIGCCSRP